MEDDEDDDIYAPADVSDGAGSVAIALTSTSTKPDQATQDLEDGEEEGEEVEEDESDSDIDIITERKDEPKREPIQAQRTTGSKPSPVRTSFSEQVRPSPSPTIKIDAPGKPAVTPPRSGSSYPPARTSKLEVDARPIYEPNGKPITEVDMDADFPEDDKPWRRPGTDMTDYFNYGFDEFTWASYCLKQETLREEVLDSKKQMEEMQSFLSMPGGMPAMPGMPGATAGAMPGMGASGEMPPDMAQMMQQMMASGMDPSQMSPDMFMQYMMHGAGGQAGMAGYGQQGQGQQQMGYGYGAGASGGGGRGRGQGRRNW